MKLFYLVTKQTSYQTIKEVLKAEFQLSDRLLLKLKKLEKIYLNNRFTYLNHPITVGDKIECDFNFEEDNSNIVPTSIYLDILYEDDCYLIINKPAGIPVHPSMEHYTDSLSNGVRYYFDKIKLKKKIRPVNRLDRNTSGIVIFAKNEYIQECLVRQMKTRQFIKKYIAVVEGQLKEKSGVINKPIARKENSIIERCISEDGDLSITKYRSLSQEDLLKISDTSLKLCNSLNCKKIQEIFEVLECTLETGRTHQIRVHFASIDHPLLGDTLYGHESSFITRQALHAYQVEFIHPILKQNVNYLAPLPKDFNFIKHN